MTLSKNDHFRKDTQRLFHVTNKQQQLWMTVFVFFCIKICRTQKCFRIFFRCRRFSSLQPHRIKTSSCVFLFWYGLCGCAQPPTRINANVNDEIEMHTFQKKAKKSTYICSLSLLPFLTDSLSLGAVVAFKVWLWLHLVRFCSTEV